MSTLRVNNIKDASGGTSNLSIDGAAKAWVNFNGTGTVAIRDDLNVSSITDNGTGQYTINYTNAFANTNYSVVGTADGTHNGSIVSIGHNDNDNSGIQTANTRMECRGGDGDPSAKDPTLFCAIAISS
jgi:hypothetical protein